MDVYSLKELMGHEDLQVLERYLKLTKGDVEAAHRQMQVLPYYDERFKNGATNLQIEPQDVSGHGTLGWTMGPGSGKALAELIDGRRPDVDFRFLGT